MVLPVLKKGPFYDPEVEKKMDIKSENLEEARKVYAELETEAPRIQAALEKGVRVEGIEAIQLIQAKQALALFLNMQKDLLSLPGMQNLLFNRSSDSLKPDDKQLVFLRFMKALFKTPVLFGDLNSVQGFIAEFSKLSIYLIYPDDHFAQLDDWMKEIVECRQLFSRYLPAVELEEGNSQGYSWAIVKNNQLRGYLFGTMHQLKVKEAVTATLLCHDIYMRLARCSVICTEIKLPGESGMGDSVENHLLKFARSYGIVNFGLDDEGRDENTDVEFLIAWNFVQDLEFTEEDVKRNPQLKIIKEAADKNREFQRSIIKAYREGNHEAMIASLPRTPKDEVEKRRQEALISKTHACLQSLEKAAIDGQIPLGFFAYGCAHMLEEGYPKTVVQGLRDLGYEVDRIVDSH